MKDWKTTTVAVIASISGIFVMTGKLTPEEAEILGDNVTTFIELGIGSILEILAILGILSKDS